MSWIKMAVSLIGALFFNIAHAASEVCDIYVNPETCLGQAGGQFESQYAEAFIKDPTASGIAYRSDPRRNPLRFAIEANVHNGVIYRVRYSLTTATHIAPPAEFESFKETIKSYRARSAWRVCNGRFGASYSYQDDKVKISLSHSAITAYSPGLRPEVEARTLQERSPD